jgi:hypothetical protein
MSPWARKNERALPAPWIHNSEFMMREICNIRIIRRSQYKDALRAYKIIINGSEVGTLSRNSRLEIEAPSGALRIEARIDWGRSQPLLIDAAPNQKIEIEVSNEWPSGLALWAITFGFRRYLTMKQSV